MKLETEKIEISKSKELIESSFGISAENSAHILGILRDKLYTDKILAVIREYCTNAYDAHVEVGCKEPIEITLPNKLEPTFIVRDYGSGLLESEMREIFVMYGASTKRNTNSMIGALGIGAKSAFSYVDSFNIISYKDGKMYEYCCYMDETKCGKIALLNQSITDKRNGIEIRIPVKQENIHEFDSKTRNTLRFMNPVPKINGEELKKDKPFLEEVINYIPKQEVGKFDSENISYMTTVSFYENKANTPLVVMGSIAYKLNFSNIFPDYSEYSYYNSTNKYSLINKIDKNKPVYTVPIGAVDMSANREELEYTNKTKKLLSNIISQTTDILKKKLSDKLKLAKTMREAKEELIKLSDINIMSDTAIWNNKIINDNIFKTYLETIHKTKDNQLVNSYSFKCYKFENNKYISLDVLKIKKGKNNPLFIEIDIPHQWKSKINRWYDKNDDLLEKYSYTYKDYYGNIRKSIEQIYCFHWPDKATKDIFFKEYNLEDYDWLKLSEMDIPKLERSPRNSYRSGRTSHLGKVFTCFTLHEKSVRSEMWRKLDKDLDKETKYYYVVLDRFVPNVNYYDLQFYYELIKKKQNNKFELNHIIGIKEKYKDKIESDWIDLIECAKTELNKPIYLQTLNAYYKIQKHSWLKDLAIAEKDITNKNSKLLGLINLIKEEIKLIKDWENINYSREYYLHHIYGYKNPYTSIPDKISSLIQECINRYPLIRKLFSNYTSSNGSYEDQIEYINFIDNKYNKKEKKNE